ncbi:MAG: RNase P subunit p30 family protein [Halodesulfurarchaeum sp.]
MYEAARVSSAGPTTAARFVLTLSRAGYDGVVLLGDQSEMPTVDTAALRDRYGVDVALGVEIDVDSKAAASGAIGNWRPKATVLALRGGSPELNRFAVESPRVDVLTAPLAGEGDLNHVMAQAAAGNGVAVEVDLSRVLRRRGGTRVRAIAGLRKLRDLLANAEAPLVVTAGARTHLQVRGPRELIAVAEQVGFDPDEVEAGLAAWGEIVARTRRDPDTVGPGIRLEDDGR